MIVGALSWYDERPTWLSACVASLAKVCSHVVAIDGAYSTFPAERPRSRPDQAEAIIRTADAAGMGYTIVSPREKWWGGEIAKRQHLLDEATTHGDWVLVLDADEVLRDVTPNLHDTLARCVEYVAELTLTDKDAGKVPIRRLFRAGHLLMGTTHDSVFSGGLQLSGDGATAETLRLTDTVIDHRWDERSRERASLKILNARIAQEAGTM